MLGAEPLHCSHPGGGGIWLRTHRVHSARGCRTHPSHACSTQAAQEMSSPARQGTDQSQFERCRDAAASRSTRHPSLECAGRSARGAGARRRCAVRQALPYHAKDPRERHAGQRAHVHGACASPGTSTQSQTHSTTQDNVPWSMVTCCLRPGGHAACAGMCDATRRPGHRSLSNKAPMRWRSHPRLLHGGGWRTAAAAALLGARVRDVAE